MPPLSNIIEYTVAGSPEFDIFSQGVNGNLKDGWQLYGNLVAFPNPIQNSNVPGILYFQAMTKVIVVYPRLQPHEGQ